MPPSYDNDRGRTEGRICLIRLAGRFRVVEWRAEHRTRSKSVKFVDFVRLFDIVDMNSGQIQEILPVTATIARKSAKFALTTTGCS